MKHLLTFENRINIISYILTKRNLLQNNANEKQRRYCFQLVTTLYWSKS